MTDLYTGFRYRVQHALGTRGAHDAYECARCGSLVLSTAQHSNWHASVDSAATTLIASTGGQQ